MMNEYVKLLRPRHYIKNILLFLPLFFSVNLFNLQKFLIVCISFFVFCMVASIVYVINDIFDIKKDKMHPIKKNRPLASGKISIKSALILLLILLIIVVGTQLLLLFCNIYNIKTFISSSLFLLIYLILNILYSKWLKNVPIMDIIVLASGFLIRVLYGGCVINVEISNWLYLTVLSISLYLVIGKRRGESKKNNSKSRKVLKYYTIDFLNKFMYLFLTSSIIFYSLWCSSISIKHSTLLIYSVIFIIFIAMKYSLNIESDSFADPIDVIYSDKLLIVMVLIYMIYMGGVIYA